MSSNTPLRRTRDYAAAGDQSALQRGLRGGSLVRVRQGAFVDADTWGQAQTEERMRLRAHALAEACFRPPVIAFASAAAVHRLPVNRRDDGRVHVLDPLYRPASTRGNVIRHRGGLDDDVQVVDGLRVTSVSRTVYDVIRTEPPEVGVVVFDAALRAAAWRGFGRYDVDAAESLRADVRARVDAASGARGVRRARFATDFADGRAQLPGESVSRLWMHLLGVDEPQLQTKVAIDGGFAYPDFAWPRLRMFGEFDGEGTYVDPALMAGRSLREVLRDQRAREGAVVAATGWTPVRWGGERVTSKPVFAAFLRAQRLLR